jgi:general secretion pathway protein M
MRPTAFSALRESWSAFWAERDARERKMLLLMTACVLLAIIYFFFINPALNGRAQLQKRLPTLRQQAAELHVLARQASDLHNAESTQVTEEPTEESIGNSLVQRGLKPRTVVRSGNAVKVQLPSSPFSGIVVWLGEMQQQAGLVVADAQIDVLPTVDTVNATLTLRQPRSRDTEE